LDLKGSKTEANLRAALAGESMARNKYTYYAAAARKAGYPKIADSLERMATNEMHHARFWFEQLYGPRENVQENLRDAAAGELEEWHQMYPSFAAQAREEGFGEVAVMFEQVAAIERDHERQFMTLLLELAAGQKETAPAASKPKVQQGYRCTFCGAVFSERPDVCSVCKAIGAFELYEYVVQE